MRLAHLILAHTNPSQLERLANRLVYTNTDIFIHLDRKADITEYSRIKSLPNVFFIKKREYSSWGNYSIIRATLNGVQEILDTGNNYSHINLLSGADYPIKDAATIQQFLFANAGKSYMRHKHVYNDWPETTSRFKLYSFGDYNFPFKYKLQGIVNKIFAPRKLPNRLEPYGFSQWVTITPAAVRYTINYLKKNANVRRFFKMTWSADELFFQTILVNSHLKDTIVNDHLRFLNFPRQAHSPEILTMADKDAIINSGKFYARKFDPQIDSQILDYLDTVNTPPKTH